MLILDKPKQKKKKTEERVDDRHPFGVEKKIDMYVMD